MKNIQAATPGEVVDLAVERVTKLLKAAKPAKKDHPYLQRKRVAPSPALRELPAWDVARLIGYHPKAEERKRKGKARGRTQAVEPEMVPLVGRILLAPVHLNGNINSVAMIDENGLKSCLAGGVVKDGAWYSKPLPKGNCEGVTFAIGEGVATVLTVTDIMGWFGVAALSCWNLPAVAEYLQQKFPMARRVILADIGNGEADAWKAAMADQQLLRTRGQGVNKPAAGGTSRHLKLGCRRLAAPPTARLSRTAKIVTRGNGGIGGPR